VWYGFAFAAAATVHVESRVLLDSVCAAELNVGTSSAVNTG